MLLAFVAAAAVGPPVAADVRLQLNVMSDRAKREAAMNSPEMRKMWDDLEKRGLLTEENFDRAIADVDREIEAKKKSNAVLLARLQKEWARMAKDQAIKAKADAALADKAAAARAVIGGPAVAK